METLEEEVARLRERVAVLEQHIADEENPNIILLRGRVCEYEGEWSALSIKTSVGLVYLADAIENFRERAGGRSSQQMTISWHMSSEPKTFGELEANVAAAALGYVETRFSHAHSDLTGYLWTNEEIKIGGHDVLDEIRQESRTNPYLVMRAEIHD